MSVVVLLLYTHEHVVNRYIIVGRSHPFFRRVSHGLTKCQGSRRSFDFRLARPSVLINFVRHATLNLQPPDLHFPKSLSPSLTILPVYQRRYSLRKRIVIGRLLS